MNAVRAVVRSTLQPGTMTVPDPRPDEADEPDEPDEPCDPEEPQGDP